MVSEAKDERIKLEDRIASLEALITRKEQLEEESKDISIPAFAQEIHDIDVEILANLEFISSTTLRERQIIERSKTRWLKQQQIESEVDDIPTILPINQLLNSSCDDDFENIPIHDCSVENDEQFEVGGEFSLGRSSICSINCSPVANNVLYIPVTQSNARRGKRGAGKFSLISVLQQTTSNKLSHLNSSGTAKTTTDKQVVSRLTFVPIVKKKEVPYKEQSHVDIPEVPSETFQSEIPVSEKEPTLTSNVQESHSTSRMNFVPIKRKQKEQCSSEQDTTLDHQVIDVPETDIENTKKISAKRKVCKIIEPLASALPVDIPNDFATIEEVPKKSKKLAKVASVIVNATVEEVVVASKAKGKSRISKKKQPLKLDFLSDDEDEVGLKISGPADNKSSTQNEVDIILNNNTDLDGFERFSAANIKNVKAMKPKAKKAELEALLRSMWSVTTEDERQQWLSVASNSITEQPAVTTDKAIDFFPPSPEAKKSRTKSAVKVVKTKASKIATEAFAVPTMTSIAEQSSKAVKFLGQEHTGTSLLNSSISVS
jgi:hypothetical protein